MLRILLGIGFVTLLTLALAVILIAIPITRRLIVVGLAEWMLGGHLESMAVDLDIQPNLRWIFILLVILPVGFGLARMVIARNFSNAARGLALALGTLLTLGVVVWWQTRHFNFDAQGRSVVYLSFRRDGVHKSYSPGIDRVTGRPKCEVTLNRVAWLSALAKQPVCQVDPAVDTNWFDPNSGQPNLWYVQTGTNQWEFFNRPMFHPQLGVEAQPITPALMKRWQKVHDRQVAAAQALERQHAAEAKAVEEKREQEERAERKRQADLRIRAEAEVLAHLEAERHEQDKQVRRTNTVAKATTISDTTAPPRGATEHRERHSRARFFEPVVDVVKIPFHIVGSILTGLTEPNVETTWSEVPVHITPMPTYHIVTLPPPPPIQKVIVYRTLPPPTYSIRPAPAVWRSYHYQFHANVTFAPRHSYRHQCRR